MARSLKEPKFKEILIVIAGMKKTKKRNFFGKNRKEGLP
jgi:hypothetical protein